LPEEWQKVYESLASDPDIYDLVGDIALARMARIEYLKKNPDVTTPEDVDRILEQGIKIGKLVEAAHRMKYGERTTLSLEGAAHFVDKMMDVIINVLYNQLPHDQATAVADAIMVELSRKISIIHYYGETAPPGLSGPKVLPGSSY